VKSTCNQKFIGQQGKTISDLIKYRSQMLSGNFLRHAAYALEKMTSNERRWNEKNHAGLHQVHGVQDMRSNLQLRERKG
jgi:hypothetical protein